MQFFPLFHSKRSSIRRSTHYFAISSLHFLGRAMPFLKTRHSLHGTLCSSAPPAPSTPGRGEPCRSPGAAPTPQGPPGGQGLRTAPPTGGCRVAAAAVPLQLLPRLPKLDRVQPGKRQEGGVRRPAWQ